MILHGLTDIDRTIYHHLRTHLVSKGYLPDINTFTSSQDYASALQAIETNGTLINLYGMGNSESRDLKRSHTFVIDRKPFVVSTTGAGNEEYTEVLNAAGELSSYDKIRNPEKALNISYTVRLITNNVGMERVMTSILFEVLGLNKYLQVADSESKGLKTDTAYLSFISDTDVTSTDWIEKVFTYTFTDVFLWELATKLKQGVPVLTKIRVGIGELDSRTIFIDTSI